MTAATIASLTTILAVLVGGLLNHFASRWSRDRDWEQSLRRQQIDMRTKLYADYLAGVQRLVAQSIDKKFSDVSNFDILYNEYARIEITASDEVRRKSKAFMDHVLECHAAENAPPKAKYPDLKREFISAAKAEIDDLAKA